MEAEKMSHCKRCTILAWLSRQPEPVTADTLAKSWGLSARTARRYLNRWEQAGAARVIKFGRAMRWEAA